MKNTQLNEQNLDFQAGFLCVFFTFMKVWEDLRVKIGALNLCKVPFHPLHFCQCNPKR